MRNFKDPLSKQLLTITAVIFAIVFFSLGILLPNTLQPTYERTIYQYLKQPLDLIDHGTFESSIRSDVAYIYISSNNEIIASDNFERIVGKASIKRILKNIKDEYGKFTYLGKNYYYNTSYNNSSIKKYPLPMIVISNK